MALRNALASALASNGSARYTVGVHCNNILEIGSFKKAAQYYGVETCFDSNGSGVLFKLRIVHVVHCATMLM